MTQKYLCLIGQCNPQRIVPNKNLSCKECLYKNQADLHGIIYQLSDYGFSCTLHNKSSIVCKKIESNHETWKCAMCNSEKRFLIQNIFSNQM
jgi:frataxin-like iron-binding protein CyaY